MAQVQPSLISARRNGRLEAACLLSGRGLRLPSEKVASKQSEFISQKFVLEAPFKSVRDSTLEGNSRKNSESVSGIFLELFRKLFRKGPAVLGVWTGYYFQDRVTTCHRFCHYFPDAGQLVPLGSGLSKWSFW